MQNIHLDSIPPRLKSPEELESEELRAAHTAWRNLAGGRWAPSRKEIGPSMFRSVLGEIFLMEVIDGGADFRFALGGDKIIRFLHSRLSTGTLLSSLSGSLFLERALRVFRQCIATKQPVAAGPSPAALAGRELMSLEALVLPLSEDDAVTSLIGAIHVAPTALAEPANQIKRSMPKAFSEPA